jgi:hypothetical protein
MLWLERIACFLPRIEAAIKGMDVLETVVQKFLRHPGA